MSVVPRNDLSRVQFYEDHVEPFTTSATEIGLTSTEATLMGTQAAAARAAYNEQQAAQLAAKAKTEAFHNTVRTLSTTGAALLKKIRAKAEQSGDPNVYVLAQIPAPATPVPVPAPGTPTDFKVILNPDGSLKLKWKCPNPAGAQGTIYQVARRIGTGAFIPLGGTGNRSFDDATLPAGTASVTYSIVAQRSTASGTPAQFIVNFGVSGGEMTATVAGGETPRLAA